MTGVAQTPISLHLDRGRSPTIELLRLALPMMCLTVSRMLMGFVDFYMVSKLGTDAQAAITPSALLLFVIACTGMGMAQGVQTFVSQADGRNEPHLAGRYVWQTLYIAGVATVVSVPIIALTPTWLRWIAWLGRHPPQVEALEVQFLSVALWSIGPMTATAGLECFFNGIRRPMIALAAILASLATITVGNYALIYGHWGFPALGIAGSGVATVLAWIVRAGVLLCALFWPSVDRRYRTRSSFAPSGHELVQIVKLGGPVSLQWLVDIGAWLVFLEAIIPNAVTPTPDQPAARAIAMAGANLTLQITHLSFMPALGIGLALATQVGNAIGARRPDEAVRRLFVARRVILAYMAVMTAVFMFGGHWLAGFFCEPRAEHREAVIAGAVLMLRWAALFQVFDALCIAYSFALRGTGDTKIPALLFLVCCWVIFVFGGSLSAWLVPRWGVSGPWLMCTAYIVVLSGLLWRRFHSEKWRGIRLFDRQAADGEVAVVEPLAAEGI